jgi:hypothetical protein
MAVESAEEGIGRAVSIDAEGSGGSPQGKPARGGAVASSGAGRVPLAPDLARFGRGAAGCGFCRIAYVANARAPNRCAPPHSRHSLAFEYSPSFSPDREHVVFIWDGPKQDNQDLHVQVIR